jgi:hypothetical protein
MKEASSTDRLATEAVESDPNFSTVSRNGSQSTATHPGANIIYLPKATSDATVAGEARAEVATDEGLVIARFVKNALGQEVRATLSTFGGYRVADLRVWQKKNDDDWRPTKKGLCVRVELLPDLLVAVAALVKAHDDERVQSAPPGEYDDAAGGKE